MWDVIQSVEGRNSASESGEAWYYRVPVHALRQHTVPHAPHPTFQCWRQAELFEQAEPKERKKRIRLANIEIGGRGGQTSTGGRWDEASRAL